MFCNGWCITANYTNKIISKSVETVSCFQDILQILFMGEEFHQTFKHLGDNYDMFIISNDWAPCCNSNMYKVLGSIVTVVLQHHNQTI